MALSNLEVRIVGTSNLASIRRDVAQLQKTMLTAQAAQNRMAMDIAKNNWDSDALDNFDSKLQEHRSTINKVASASGQYYVTQRNLTTATADFNDRLARQKVRFNEVFGPSSMKMMRASMKEQMAMQNMIVNSYRRSGDKVDVDIWTPNPAALGNARNLRKEIGYLAQAYSAVAVQVTNWGKNIQWAGRQLTVGFSVPLTLALGGLSRLGFELDRQLVRVEKVYGDGEAASQVTNQAIRDMATDTAKHVAQQWGIAGQSTLDVMAELAATGLEGPDLQSMTVQTQRASLLGDLSTEESLKTIRTLKEAYRQNNDEIERSINLFNEVENSTALTMNDISEGLPRVAGILQATGVSLEDTLVLLTGFKEAGIDIAEGANALKSINFKAIAASPTAAKNFLEITGRDIEQIVDAAGGDFMTVMYEIADIMQTLNQQEQVDLIARVFGIHQGGRTITLLNQLATGSDGMTRANEAAAKSTETLAATADAELKKLADSTSQRLLRVKESIMVTFGEIGVVALDMVMPLFEGFGKFVNWLGGLPDWIKKLGIGAALGLIIIGPMVMLIGLFANLVGMMGRAGLAVVKLLAPFKILTMESKAAQLLQQQFGSSVDRTTAALLRQATAMTGLTNIISASNAKMMGGSPGSVAPIGPFPAAAPGGATAMSGSEAKRYAAYTGSASASQWLNHDRQVRGIAASTDRATVSATKFGASWAKASGAVAVTSGSVMMLSSMMGNEFLTNASLGVMALTSLAPVAAAMSRRVGASMGKMAKNTGTVFGSIAGAGTKMLGGLGQGALGLARIMTGPVGLAIGGVVAIAAYAWKKHADEVKRVKAVYDDVRNTVDQLGEAYGFIGSQSLEEKLAGGVTWDEGSIQALQINVKNLRDNNADYVTTLNNYANEMNSTYDTAEAKVRILNEAMRQGNLVMAQTGDSQKAWQAAWEAASVMGLETMSLDKFKVQVSAEWGPNAFTNLSSAAEARLRELSETLETVKIRGEVVSYDPHVGTSRSGNFVDYFKITEGDKRELQANFQALMESLEFVPGDKQFEILSPLMGSLADDLADYYKEWQKVTGDTETTFMEFMNNLNEVNHSMKDAGVEGIISDEDLAVARQIWPIYEQFAGAQAEELRHGSRGLEISTGRLAMARDLIDAQDELNIKKKYENALNSESPITRAAAEFRVQAELDEIGRSRLGIENLKNSALNAGTAIKGMAGGVVDGLEEIDPAADEATRKLEEMAQTMVDTRRSLMKGRVDGLIGEYMKEFDKVQDGERRAFDASNQKKIDDINTQFDEEQRLQDSIHEGNMAAFEKRRENATEALKEDFQRESDALDDRFQMQKDSLDKTQQAADDALDRRQEAEDERAKKRQESRRKAIEASYDARVESVRELIEAEQEAERRRQEIFEAEKERISRMSEMFNQNVDLNMAINSGDLDQAAKIANNMASQTQQWGLDDASEISKTASERRIDELETSIDAIEKEKDARLEALSEVEKAEDKARKDKQEAEKKHLDELQKQQDRALTKSQEAERRALAKAQELRQKSLDERVQSWQDAIDAENAKQTQAIADRRTEDVAAQEETNRVNSEALETRLSNARESMELEFQARAAMTPRNEVEFDRLNESLRGAFSDSTGKQVEISDARVKEMTRNYETEVTRSLNEFRDDQNWAGMAEQIAKKMTEGVFGSSVSVAEMRRFHATGELPKSVKSTHQPGDVRTKSYYKHSGGVVGESASSRVGYSGNNLSFSEVPTTMLRGEGVLNLRAMRQPGMKEFLDNANAGRAAAPGSRQGDGMGMPYGVMLGTLRNLQQNVAIETTARGLERGVAMNEVYSGMPHISGTGAVSQLSPEQISNAMLIRSVGQSMPGISMRDIMIGIMTAMQESSLRNINHGHLDSLGLFQQRPSMGWGSPQEVTNPEYATRKFFTELLKVRNRDAMATWEAADAVQRSAYPTAYGRHEAMARELMGLDIELPDNTNMSINDRMAEIEKRVAAAVAREDESLSGVPPASGRFSGDGIGHERMWEIISKNIPHAVWSSGFRSRQNTSSGLRSYHNAGRALDVYSRNGPSGMMEIFNWIRSAYGAKNHELYYSPAENRQIQQGRSHRPTGLTRAQHFDHVHWAMKNGGIVPGMGYGDIVPSMLEPKEYVVNRRASDTFMPLLQAINTGNWDRTSSLIDGGIDNRGGTEYNVTVAIHGNVSSDVDLARAVEQGMRKVEAKRAWREGGKRRIGR